MIRRGFAILVTSLIFGAVGFGAGAYLPTAEEAQEFHALVDSEIAVMKKALRSALKKPVADKSKLESSEASQTTPEAQ